MLILSRLFITIEDLVEEIGGFNAVQRHRLWMLRYLLSFSRSTSFTRNIVTIEENLRITPQREEYLKEETRRLQERVCTPENKIQLEEWDAQIKELQRRYWKEEREWYRCESLCPPGPQKRGFHAWRATTDWYHHSALRYHCAGRGECCGRSCGCCERRGIEATGRTRLAVGHCTVECGCCMRDRGFDLTAEEKKEQHEAFGVMLRRPNDAFVERIVAVNIWGIIRGPKDERVWGSQ
ncbi:hypothetical protein ASPZODRAFT_143574 [Penicilliopsis zonata CBS 506.65]|uniref:Uncharacterized protein n=1 Tax=Penicilliopsis zonata CBS 506.65 TaxID=1073090 RepID=A0A1L9SEW2_9EURO|nr:hypothetical protein ASPZODRAFT_143574 [Penicilliopsis zonata CBS 506.65]OJJ45688.1 hypothetical protein ASPZODRAFT_143574 [Penicilliopsis zonata CBS 506.65]